MFRAWVSFSVISVLTTAYLALPSAGIQPNIIVIIADDLGWNDVSFHGSPQIPTPNLDAMAADGLVLDNYYVQPLCTPSRAALMTGYYPIHTGLQHSVILAASTRSLPLNFTIMPQYLKGLGYATHAVGKWHLGHYKKECTPTFRGFDSFFGSYTGYGDYYDHTANEGPFWGLDLHNNLEPAWNESGEYATDLYSRKATDIIHKHNTSNPLFLYLAHKAVHFGNEYGRLAAPVKYTRHFPHIRNVNRRIYAGMVSALDQSTGEIFEALQEKGLLDNSIVLFTTDNGGDSYGTTRGSMQNVSSNWPLRGGKMTLWDGGIRAVGVLWTSHLSQRKNVQKPLAIRTQLVHITDWLPTLYRAAGGEVKDLGDIDGVDMWQSLIHNEPSPRSEVLLNIDNKNGVAGIISKNFKLLKLNTTQNNAKWFKPAGRDPLSVANMGRLPILVNQSKVAVAVRKIGRYFQSPTIDFYTRFNVTCDPRPTNVTIDNLYLFNIRRDPCEYNNIAHERPEIVQLLLSRVEEFNQTVVNLNKKVNVVWADPDLHGFRWTNWADSLDQSTS